MRILLVSPMAPADQSYGAAMRVGITARALAELGTMDLVLLTGEPGDQPLTAAFRHTVALPPRTSFHPAAALLGSSVPAQIEARRRRLLAVRPDWLTATRYDLVWYNRERSYLVAAPLVHARHSIVDVDDLEDVVLRRWLDLGLDTSGRRLTARRRWQMRADARWWRAAHGRIARRVDVQVFASDTDRCRTGAAGSVVVPNTYPEPGEVGRIAAPHPTIVFPGLLTYPPNEDAAVWMAEQILPRIRQDLPDLRLLLVGEPSDRVRSLAGIPGVEVTGRVPSTAPYLRAADLVLVPLRVGGGTRIKILEAFAYEVAVVATSIGAEGLGTEPGVHLEIADDAAGLAGHCLRLLTDPAARTRITAAARELYRREYLPQRARDGVLAAVELALAAGGRRAQGHG